MDQKTNEIPLARQLFEKLDLEERRVSLDALYTQTQTGLDLVQEHGADYTLTVKDNQPRIHETIKRLLPDIPAAFPPSGGHEHSGSCLLPGSRTARQGSPPDHGSLT